MTTLSPYCVGMLVGSKQGGYIEPIGWNKWKNVPKKATVFSIIVKYLDDSLYLHIDTNTLYNHRRKDV